MRANDALVLPAPHPFINTSLGGGEGWLRHSHPGINTEKGEVSTMNVVGSSVENALQRTSRTNQ